MAYEPDPDSTAARDGGPAFPRDAGNNAGATHGMSLRDWFAGQVLAGMLANSRSPQSGLWEAWALDAYELADAMLEARKPPKPHKEDQG